MLNFASNQCNCAMRLLLLYLITCVIVVVTAGCGASDHFEVKGTIDDGSSLNLRYIYYVDGSVRTGLTASTDGKFGFEGTSPGLSVVEIYDNDYRFMGRFLARNGDKVKIELNRKNPYMSVASGTKENDELSGFYNVVADSLHGYDAGVRNRVIERYVAEHDSNIVAMTIVACDYDASLGQREAAFADSVLSGVLDFALPFKQLAARAGSKRSREPIVAINYKGRGNKTAAFVTSHKGRSVIAVSDDAHERDSVVATLRKIDRLHDIGILDLSVDADTMVWTRSIRTDSASWEQGWVAGSISGQSLGRLAIPKLPYYVVADSAGRQLWRGNSHSELLDFLDLN